MDVLPTQPQCSIKDRMRVLTAEASRIIHPAKREPSAKPFTRLHLLRVLEVDIYDLSFRLSYVLPARVGKILQQPAHQSKNTLCQHGRKIR
jgi:hypothetical protein